MSFHQPPATDNTRFLDNFSYRINSSTYRQNQQQNKQHPSSRVTSPTAPAVKIIGSNKQQQQQRGKRTNTSSTSTSTTFDENNNNNIAVGNENNNEDENSPLQSIDPEVLVVHPPGDDRRIRRSDYISRYIVEHQISNVRKVSETGVNPTKLYDLRVAGMNHVEGGWPKDCDLNDPEHRLRHLRRTRKETSFLATVKDLALRSMPVLRSNNSLDIYHSMFRDIIEGNLGEGIHANPIRINPNGMNSNNNNNNNGDDDLSSRKKKNNDLDLLVGGDDMMKHHNKSSDNDDDDDDGGDLDDHADDDLADDNNNDDRRESKSKISRKRRQRRERELAAKKAQLHVEELQVACLAGRTVGINATGVFRDAPRAFPADLLGSEVKDLVKHEQKRIQEQRKIRETEEAIALATKAMMRTAAASSAAAGGDDEDDDENENENDLLKKEKSQQQQHQQNQNTTLLSKDDSSTSAADFDALGTTQKMVSNLNAISSSTFIPNTNNNNNTAGSRALRENNDNSEQQQQQQSPNAINDLGMATAASTTTSSTKKVVLGPSASYTEPKVVSSLSWVSNLEIPTSSSSSSFNPTPMSSSSSSSNVPGGRGGGGGIGVGDMLGGGGSNSSSNTTLAIALASVQNTPHLALLGSTAKSELIRSSNLFMSQFGNGNNNNHNSKTQDVHVNTSRTKTTKFVRTPGEKHSSSSSSSSSSNVTMCGVDIFPTSLIYDANSPQAPLMRLKTASDLIQLEFSPRDTPLLASGSSDGTISLFDLRRGATRCLVVSDVCNSYATVLSAASSSSVAASPLMARLHQHQQSHTGGGGNRNTSSSASPGNNPNDSNNISSYRRNPLHPVCALRWVPSSTGGRCTEFVTADLSPYVRIWDTRFVSRGCLDTFNLNSGTVVAAVRELEQKLKRDARMMRYGMTSTGSDEHDHYSSTNDVLDDEDDDDRGSIFGSTSGHKRHNKHHHKRHVHHHKKRGKDGNNEEDENDDFLSSSNNNTSGGFFNPLKAVSIDIQTSSGRVYIGTTDGKVFAFNRKGRTDSDRLCGVFQVVPRDQTRYFTSTALNLFATCSSSSTFAQQLFGSGENNSNNNDPFSASQSQQQGRGGGIPPTLDVYVHVAAHPTLPKCFATATEWGVSVFADDLPRPVAQLPPSPHGVATSIRWVPHCAALLCISRMSGTVELWDLCVMLTSPVLLNHQDDCFSAVDQDGTTSNSGNGNNNNNKNHLILGGGSQPKAIATIMEYSGPSGYFSSSATTTTATDRSNIVQEYGNHNSSSTTKSVVGPPISSIRFSPDGSNLVAGLADGSTTLLDVTVKDDDNLVKAAEDAQLNPKLNPNLSTSSMMMMSGGGGNQQHQQTGNTTGAVAGLPQILGARGLELACFSKIVEKRGVQRTKRLMQLQQQNAPDVTTASTLHYHAAGQQQHRAHQQQKDEEESNKNKEDDDEENEDEKKKAEKEKEQEKLFLRQQKQQQHQSHHPSMTHDRLTSDMARLSQQFQTSMVSLIDHSATKVVNEYNHPPKSGAPPPFKSADSRTCRVMDRVGNFLYNPLMNLQNNNDNNNNDEDEDDTLEQNDDAEEEESMTLNKKKKTLVPLSAPLAEDDSAVTQLSRAIETGVAVPPQRTRSARRWSTVRRHLSPKTQNRSDLEMDHYQGRRASSPNNNSGYTPPPPHASATTTTVLTDSSRATNSMNFGRGGSYYQPPSAVFVPADEQIAQLKQEKQQQQQQLKSSDDKNNMVMKSSSTVSDDVVVVSGSGSMRPRRARATAFIDNAGDDNNDGED